MKHFLPFLFCLLLSFHSCRTEHKEDHSLPKQKILKAEPKFTASQRLTSAHIRGLYLVNDQVGWASGTEGIFLRMTDGSNWVSDSIPDYTHLDFRDIHAFDSSNAVIMAAGEEGRILRTSDGGNTWNEVYTNLEEGIFLDGIDFDGDIGYCIGDPLNGRPLILRSTDKGKTWNRVDPKTIGSAIPGEGSYAASGTTIVSIKGMNYAAYGGDSLIRVLKNQGQLSAWESIEAPLAIGPGCGIFSMAFKDAEHGVAVGGCYLDSLAKQGNCAITHDSGKSWQPVDSLSPTGYRSCVAYAPSSSFYIACGRSGIDISYDDGQSWEPLSSSGYFSAALGDSTGWLMGRNGKMSRIDW